MIEQDEEHTINLRNQLQREILRDKEEFRYALEEIKQATRHAISPARIIRKSPVIWLGSAFALGFALGFRG